jgi:hypothetical protein
MAFQTFPAGKNLTIAKEGHWLKTATTVLIMASESLEECQQSFSTSPSLGDTAQQRVQKQCG